MGQDRPRGTWRMWRLGGVDYLVKPSLLLMCVVLVVVFTDRFDGHTRTAPVIMAIGFVVGLYASVLIHEMAHVVTARSFGLRVRSVTLHLLGGETAIEGDSRRPAQELITAGIGPVASLAIGLVCRVVEPATSGAVADLLWTIGTVNFVVAVFNLLPALPLDGGRVLRAIIWATSGNEALGIKVAAWIGRVVAVVGVAAVAAAVVTGNLPVVNLVLAALIATFIWVGADQSLRHADRSGRINALSARAIAKPGTVPAAAPHLDADLHGTLLLREIAAHPADRYAVTEPDGTFVGVLTLDDLDAAYRGDATP